MFSHMCQLRPIARLTRCWQKTDALGRRGGPWSHRLSKALICSKLRAAPLLDGFRASKRAPLSDSRSVASSKNVSCCGSNTIPRCRATRVATLGKRLPRPIACPCRNTRPLRLATPSRTNHMTICPIRLRGSGGRGLSDGGEGIERNVLMLEDVTVSLITERRSTRPWGINGGEPGASGENWLLPGGDETHAEMLPAKCTLHLKAGDVLRMLTPGGGGWGIAQR